MKTCYIIGAGECGKINLKKQDGDFVVCADGGFAAALRNGIEADLAVGDFDSLGEVPKNIKTIVHPAEKDETDSLLAVDCGLRRGYKRFVMFGMLGGRLDHTFANIQLLSYLCEKGAFGVLLGDGYCAAAVKNSSVCFPERTDGMISVFSLSNESSGVEISGLKYQVKDFSLSSSFPVGVSNEFIGKESKISVKSGTLAVLWESADGFMPSLDELL